MPPPPPRTIAFTVAASGAASSRFGPIAPDVPASASVWQPPQFAVKISLPLAAVAATACLVGGGFSAPMTCGPISSTATANAATSHVTGPSTRSIVASIRATGSRSW